MFSDQAGTSNRPQTPASKLIDPQDFKRAFWPHVRFYKKQWDIVYSVRDNDETYCYAAHQMGKDFVAGFVVLWYFLASDEPCRIITTSVKDDHLRVLWGEIGRYLDTSAVPLRKEQGGPLVVTHREIRKMVYHDSSGSNGGVGVETDLTTRSGANQPGQQVRDPYLCKISYVKGMVSERGEGMAGHHASRTLLVVDEASGVDEIVVERASSWAKREYIFGNPYSPPNSGSWFKRNCLGGDVPYAANP